MLCKGFELAQSDKTAAVTPPDPSPTVTCHCGRDIQTVVRWGAGWHGYCFAVPDHDDGKTPAWEGAPIRVVVEEDRMIRLPASVLAALGVSAGDSVDFTRSGQVFYMSRSVRPTADSHR